MGQTMIGELLMDALPVPAAVQVAVPAVPAIPAARTGPTQLLVPRSPPAPPAPPVSQGSPPPRAHTGFDEENEPATVCAYVEPALPKELPKPRRARSRTPPAAPLLPAMAPSSDEMTLIPQIAYRARPKPIEKTELERLPTPPPRGGRTPIPRLVEVTPQRYIATQITPKPETIMQMRGLTTLLPAPAVPSLDLVPIIAGLLVALAIGLAIFAL
jgi:hypothetical protein